MRTFRFLIVLGNILLLLSGCVTGLSKDAPESISSVSSYEFIPIDCDDIESFYDGVAIIKKNKQYGAVDTKGNVLLEAKYTWMEITKELYKSFGVERYAPTQYLPPIQLPEGYDSYEVVNNKYYILVKGDKFAFFNENLNMLTSTMFDYVENVDFPYEGFINGLTIIKINGKYAILDEDFNPPIILNNDYESVHNFYGNLALVKKQIGEKLQVGAINRKGELKIPIVYDGIWPPSGDISAFNFSNGFEIFMKEEKRVIINISGEIFFETTEKIYKGNKCFFHEKDGKIAVLGNDLEYLNNFYYDSVYELKQGFKVTLGNKVGVVDELCNEVLPMVFDQINVESSDAMFATGKLNGQYGIIIKGRGGISVYCDGSRLSFDVPPVLENDRVLVPMRKIFESLGATVDWDGDTQTVTAKKDDTEIILQIGSDILYKNGNGILLDVPAKIVNDRTLVPIRAVSEGLGASVTWNEEENTVEIVAE